MLRPALPLQFELQFYGVKTSGRASSLILPLQNNLHSNQKIIHKSPTIPGSPIAIQKDLPQELKDKVKDFLLSYDNPEYFGDEEGKEPERFIAIEDSAYDYIRELKEKYNLSD